MAISGGGTVITRGMGAAVKYLPTGGYTPGEAAEFLNLDGYPGQRKYLAAPGSRKYEAYPGQRKYEGEPT